MFRIWNLESYPDQAQYRPKGNGNIIARFEASEPATLEVTAEFLDLNRPMWNQVVVQNINAGSNFIAIPFEAPDSNWSCFGVDITLKNGGKTVGQTSTAWDVADHWRRAPRYGFLSDFGPDEVGRLDDIAFLARMHLNVVQFYDWMYRHDELIPPDQEFIDPMGRVLSYQATKERIEALHERGAAAMAYGTVYASLRDFHSAHPEWCLYKRTGEPFELGDTFFIMDISPGTKWSDHIINQYRLAIREGFDGIHMDQYGYPKQAYRYMNQDSDPVDLAECYPALINRAKAALRDECPKVGLIFNNVTNYPVHTTAGTEQDAVYIEVWPPYIHFRDLRDLIHRARELSKGKQVILAAYLPAFRPELGIDASMAETGAMLTMATIFANGGYHLLLGENGRVLTEGYYPNYGKMRPEFAAQARQYYDFIVRYGHLLYDEALLDISMAYTGGLNVEVTFTGEGLFEPNGNPGTVWTIMKQAPGYKVIHLINLMGLENDLWDQPKANPPTHQENIVCRVLAERPVCAIYYASPDGESIRPEALKFQLVEHQHGQAVEFVIPSLDYWDMVFIEEH